MCCGNPDIQGRRRRPNDEVDARVVIRTPQSGRYFVRVQDDKYAPEDVGRTLPMRLFYHLTLGQLSDGKGAFAAQADSAEPKRIQWTTDPSGKNHYVTR